MLKKILSCFLFTFIGSQLIAQISFVNRNDLLSNSDFHSGVAMGVVDMNGDGKDDIVRMDQGYQLNIEYQNDANAMFTNKLVGDMGSTSRWSMCIADLDNNGYNEVIASGAYDEIRIAVANGAGTEYSTGFLEGGNQVFVQGSNFADINNDGILDVFACHDDGASRIWQGNADGTLSAVDWIDFSIDGSTGEPASGNYGSTWVDIDNDGDIDLYIAKCRQGATDPTDTRRINLMYINDGNGSFTEEGADRGLAIGWQSWSADFQDVDNDGDQDCFITNHDHEAQLLLNDGNGYFTEVENTGINVAGFPIQGIMRDFDNDGFNDIIVAGSDGQIFHNNGDLTFTEITNVFDASDMESFALGDLNNDGYVDVYGGYANVFTNPSNIDDILWLNANSGNNHLSVQLQGISSNRTAVGAKVEIYGDWGIQIREVRAGESYGISNSATQYFGLDQASEIDSLIVRWPSGEVQLETNVAINSTIILLEGSCLAAAPELSVAGEQSICTGETLTISGPDNLNSYVWSTGETTQSIEVSTAGNYSLEVSTSEGCIGFSSNVLVMVDPQMDPMISSTEELNICDGEAINIFADNIPLGTEILWSNGGTNTTNTIMEAGTYSYIAQGACAEFTSNEVTLTVSETPDSPIGTGDLVDLEQTAELMATGDQVVWFDAEVEGNQVGEGNTFITPPLSESTTYYAEDRLGTVGIASNVGMLEHQGTSYSGTDATNTIIFDAYQGFILNEVTVFTDTPGERIIVLFDSEGNVLQTKTMMIEAGESRLTLDMEIPQGDRLALGTDLQTNITNLGQNGPRLMRSSEGVMMPYIIDDVVSLNDSPYGPNWYYYFYDWEITTLGDYCASQRIAVEAEVTGVSNNNISESDAINIYPNPASTDLYINLDLNNLGQDLNVSLSDFSGRTVLEQSIPSSINRLDISPLASGIYNVKVIDGDDVYVGKVSIMR